jgi:hypothetical protein
MKVALSSEGKIILELELWEVTLLHHVTTRVPNPWNDLYIRALQKAREQGLWALTPVDRGV